MPLENSGIVPNSSRIEIMLMDLKLHAEERRVEVGCISFDDVITRHTIPLRLSSSR